MAANGRADKFEIIGTTQGDVSDAISSTPVGNPTVPPADQQATYTPIAGGTPAPPP